MERLSDVWAVYRRVFYNYIHEQIHRHRTFNMHHRICGRRWRTIMLFWETT